MYTRKWRRWVVLLILLPLTSYLWCESEADGPRLSLDNYKQLRPGMTLADAVELLGPPSRIMHPYNSPYGGEVFALWDDNEATLSVRVNEAGAVSEARLDRRPMLSRLRRWWRGAFHTGAPF